jgi:hypothetical protein
MRRKSNYDKYPCIPMGEFISEFWSGWPQILEVLKGFVLSEKWIVCVECYPGTFEQALCGALQEGLCPALVISTSDLLKTASSIDRMLGGALGDDPVFGRMNGIKTEDFFDEHQLARAREKVKHWHAGMLLIVGTGAALVSQEPDVLIYVDVSRWEIQSRQRRNLIGNLGGANLEESAALKYKRAFFVDWRAADSLKKDLLPRIDFLLDGNSSDVPKLITGHALREGLRKVANRPFRVVPLDGRSVRSSKECTQSCVVF